MRQTKTTTVNGKRFQELMMGNLPVLGKHRQNGEFVGVY